MNQPLAWIRRIAFLPALIALATASHAATASTTTYRHLEATLDDGRVPITLDLLVEGTAIEGSYYRADRGAWTILQGELKSTGRLTLIERNGEGQEVARFSARRTSGGTFVGTWRGLLEGADDIATVSFSARETSSGSARLRAVVLKDVAFARPGRRTRNAPSADFVAVGAAVDSVPPSASPGALAALDRNLLRFFTGTEPGAPDPSFASLRAYSSASRDSYFREYREAVAEEGIPTHALRWAEISRAFVRLNEADLLVIEEMVYGDRGGAHGSYASRFGIFDLRTGSRLMRRDLLLPRSEARLRPMLKERVIAMIAERTGEPASESDLLIEGDFPVTDNIFLRRDGIGFHYNVYEVAAYAVGDFDVVFTWNELRGLLRGGSPADRLREVTPLR